MQKAMQAVLDFPQKASRLHCEAWYGFFTTYSGGKFFPDEEIISKVHVNLKSNYVVEVQFESKSVTKKVKGESIWFSSAK